MADLDIVFATNRNRLPDAGGIASFGSLVGPSSLGIAFGTATVTGVDLDDPAAGTVARAEVMNFGAIGPELADRMLHDQERDLLVFVHGAANTFTDALQRAAFNTNWINTTPGRKVTTIAFSWPARAYPLADVLAVPQDYRADQAEAAASAGDFVEFIQALDRLKAAIGTRRMTLLAHSMGNYMMGFGVAAWVRTPRGQALLFDDAVLAAADEFSTTFAAPAAGRLSDLWSMCGRVTVYSSRADVLMLASHIVNGDWRLGYDGPPNRASTAFFPPDHYSFVDCTGNTDFTQSFFAAPDRTHQYYRQSLSARADVARVLKGVAATQAQRTYDAARNVFSVPVAGAGTPSA